MNDGSTSARLNRTRVLVGAIAATGIIVAAAANVCAARTDGAISAASEGTEPVAPATIFERSGSLAVYPLLY